jgi:16S rRNA (cytosine967-C5)-methyltransferase
MKKEQKPRNLALRVLDGLSPKGHAAGHSLDALFLRERTLDERDRAFISQLVQGVLRWRLRLDWIIEERADFPLKKIHPTILNALRLALYQIFFLDRVPESAAVNEAVKQAKRSGARHISGFVNGILRNICRNREGIRYPDRERDPVLYLSVFYSYPPWLVEKWIRERGEAFAEGLLSAGNRLPVLAVRTNTLRLNRAELMETFRKEGIIGKPTPYAPEGILLEGFRGRVDGLLPFRDGLFQVQDEAAQIASHLLAPRPGETLLDVCAGLGGKTTHLAQLMGDGGRITALDINRGRLINLVGSSRRLRISGITPVVADGTGSLSSLFRTGFDRVMIDAPCSGLGVLSRHPDGKWNRNEEDIRRLALLQGTILNRAASVVKKGGRILYVTCTISREENEEVVRNLLDVRKDLSLADLREHAPEWARGLVDDYGFFRTFPHIHDMDGFFAALLTKK